LVLFIVLTGSTKTLAHSEDGRIVLCRYPMSSAVEVSTATAIGVTLNEVFSQGIASFAVSGSHSGLHKGSVKYSVDRSTIIFKPETSFDLNEHIQVTLTATTGDGGPVLDTFSFQTVRTMIDPRLAVLTDDPVTSGIGSSTHHKPTPNAPLDGWSGLVNIFNSNPTPGKVFFSLSAGPLSGLIILDELGGLITLAPITGTDFLLQPNGEMTYFDGIGTDYGLDSSLNVVDSFTCTNGYASDAHELIVQKDGGYTILGVTLTDADLSKEPGGSSNAIVQGNVIQTFDSGRNLVFEWRGIDHYDPTDALDINFTVQPVDFEHANSIDIDSAGNYLLSNRHLSEVTKINGHRGDMIWRFGGTHNEFTSVNDTLGISYQHCARFLPNDHILLFDNGNLHAVPQSRAVEFSIDTIARKDSLVWQYRHDPPISSTACGSVQRLPNGNTFIGWGIQIGGPLLPTEASTEVQPNGTVVSDWSFGSMAFSYRAMKYYTPQVSANVSTRITPSTNLQLTATQSSDGYVVSFSMDRPSQASISLYNMMGSKVATLFDGMGSTLLQSISILSNSLPSGTYFVVLSTLEGKVVRPIVIFR
jgi:hypothetical protein